MPTTTADQATATATSRSEAKSVSVAKSASLTNAVRAVLACGAIMVGAAACNSSGPASEDQPQVAPALIGRPAPASWLRTTLPGGSAVLAYPPSMHLVSGDRGTVTAARITASGQYLLYLNVTPRQGTETSRDWVQFRIDHQREDDARAVRELSEEAGVRFLGGTGTCVTDAYVTKVDAHHFTEFACFVKGRTSATVIVAAAPTANWASSVGVLRRAIAGYRVS
jgi:hypothetical protein